MAFFTQKPPFDVTFKKPALRWAGWFNSLGGEPAFLRSEPDFAIYAISDVSIPLPGNRHFYVNQL